MPEREIAPVRIPSDQRPRIDTVVFTDRRADGTIFALYDTDMWAEKAEFVQIASLSEQHHSTLKAQADTGMVFQDEAAFQRWIES